MVRAISSSCDGDAWSVRPALELPHPHAAPLASAHAAAADSSWLPLPRRLQAVEREPPVPCNPGTPSTSSSKLELRRLAVCEPAGSSISAEGRPG